MRRAGLALAAAALVVLAGCGGLAGGESGGDVDRTLTPAPVPTPEPALAPGVGPEQLHASTLVVNHRQALADSNYTVVTTLRFTSPEYNYTQGSIRRVTAGQTRYYARQNYSDPALVGGTQRIEIYFDGNRTHYRQLDANATSSVSSFRSRLQVDLALTDQLRNILPHVEPTRTEREGGATVVGGPVASDAVLPAPPQTTAQSNATAAARVRESGLIDRVAISYTARQNGTRGRVRFTYRVYRVGETSVDPPTWVQRANESAA